LLFLAILLLTFLGMVSSRDLSKRLLKVTSNVARDEKVTATESPGCRCLMLSPDETTNHHPGKQPLALISINLKPVKPAISSCLKNGTFPCFPMTFSFKGGKFNSS